MISTTYNIFISYAHKDNDWDDKNVHKIVESLKNALKVVSRNKYVFFVDVQQTGWGDIWRNVVEKNLNEATFMIAFMSPSYFGSAECYKEWNDFRALERSYSANTLILPIYYRRDTEFEEYISGEHDIADPHPMLGDLARRQFYDMRGMQPLSPDFATNRSFIEDLAARIESRASQVSLIFEDSVKRFVDAAPKPPEEITGDIDPKLEATILSRFHILTNTQRIILKATYERPSNGEVAIDMLKSMVDDPDVVSMSNDEFFYRIKDLSHQELLGLKATGIKQTSVCIIKAVQITMHRNKLIKS